MPISLRRSGAGGKDKKTNSKSEDNDSSVISAEGVAAKSTDSSQNVSKNGTEDSPSNFVDMKAIIGRGSKVKQLDPDSSSLGSVETGKEAKERDKNRSWMKTIGIRTLRKKKNQDLAKGKDKDTVSEIGASSTCAIPSSASTSVIPESLPVSVEEAMTDKNGGKKSFRIKKSSSAQSSANASGANGSMAGTNGDAGGLNAKSGSTHSKSGSKSGGKTANAEDETDKQDPARFAGDGMTFKGKLIGVLEVSGPRGDRICQEALSELKMAVKAAGEHKQKITIHIALDGLRIRDEKTGDCLYHHQVHKISFIAQDLTDARAFGYIFGSPDMGHRFFGIKTEKSASQVVISMRDLFQVVFDLKKKEIERAKQQLEMQQKFLATRAAETAPKAEPKSSIAETYIEGACAVSGPSGGAASQEVDLLNLEVELNSLQEGLDNIHTNLADTMQFRGSTASISSDPMNPKVSVSSLGATNNNFVGGANDPFGDSFDPFDTSNAFVTAGSAGPKQGVGSIMTSSSPVVFGAADPFAQIDPFPTPKFNNLESSDSFFSSDPFDSPVANTSFSFGHDRSGGNNSTSSVGRYAATFDMKSENQNEQSAVENLGEQQKQSFTPNWQASFEDVRDDELDTDNFVSDSGRANMDKQPGLDIFTELDPLGTGKVKPFVDRKDFFQNLKNPPRRGMRDFNSNEKSDYQPTGDRYSDNFGMNASFSPSQLNGNESSSIGFGGAVGQNPSNSATSATLAQLPSVNQVQQKVDPVSTLSNSFSTNFNPTSNAVSSTSSSTISALAPLTGFDSAFKSPAHASVMSITAKTAQGQDIVRNSKQYGSAGSRSSRSDTSPRRSPQTISESQQSRSILGSSSRNRYTTLGSVSNNEYFTGSLENSQPPPLLPPPSSHVTSSPILGRAMKKSPQLLKQMTISSTGAANTGSSSPKTLPRSARLGKYLSVDASSSEDNNSIPNLTPPPRPPHTGTLGKTKTLSTAVPRPYSTLTGLGAGNDQRGNSRYDFTPSFTVNRNTVPTSGAPEPPPRPLQTTMISALNAGSALNQQSVPLVSPPPPLPPKKSAIGTTLSSPLVFGNKRGVTADFKRESRTSSVTNDLPLPLPSRKNHDNSWNGGINSTHMPTGQSQSERYCFPQSNDSGLDDQPKLPSVLPKLSMEQALQQVASMSLGQLATKLECPVESLSSFTIQQLAEKLTLMEISRGSSPANFMDAPKKFANFGGSVKNLNFNSSHQTEMTFDDDFSTMSAPADVVRLDKARQGFPVESNSNNFDKYAVFRELTVEDASGFTIGGDLFGSSEYQFDEENSQSRTVDLDKTLTGRDSSSERTFQVDGPGNVAIANASTMDDVTDANLSDDQDKFPLDDEEMSVSPSTDLNSHWATFETHFEDTFNNPLSIDRTEIPKGMQANAEKSGLFSLSSKTKPESPWDSDDSGGTKSPALGSHPAVSDQKYRYTEDVGDKLLDVVLPPDPEEFNFQPFEKPAPVLVAAADGVSMSRESSAGKRSTRNRDSSFDPLELDSRGNQFIRQSSGSSKHSMSRNSDYSDSGRKNSSRKNSRENEHWECGTGLKRDRGRDGDHCSYRSDSRNSLGSRRNSGDRKLSYRDSEDDFDSIPIKGSGPTMRDGMKRGTRPRISRNPEDEEEEIEDDDDRSYASFNSNHSSSKKSRPRRHGSSQAIHASLHPPSSSRRHGRRRHDVPEVSPERFSNNDSDCDGDSYEDDRRKESHSRDYYDRGYSSKRSREKDRPASASGGSGSSRRYSDRERYEHDKEYGPRYSDRRYVAQDRRRGPREYRYRGRNYSPEGPGERDYSDVSGEDYDGSSSMRRRRREQGRSRPDEYSHYRDRDRRDRSTRDRHYSVRSASFDSESQSPEQDGGESCSGGDKRKIRFDARRSRGTEREHDWRSREASNSPVSRPLPAPSDTKRASGEKFSRPDPRSDYQFDSFSPGPEDKFSSAFTEPLTNQKVPPPQSPFEDNFVEKQSVNSKLISDVHSPVDAQPPSIEYKRGSEEDQFTSVTGDVFFSAKFDVDLEVEMEAKLFNDAIAASLSSEDTPAAQTPSSADPIRASPSGTRIFGSSSSFSGHTHTSNKRLESIRSEEERLESSEDGGGEDDDEKLEEDCNKVTTNASSEELSKTEMQVVGETDETNESATSEQAKESDVLKSSLMSPPLNQVPCESSMKKSDSYNIFEQPVDPFGDDDFFS